MKLILKLILVFVCLTSQVLNAQKISYEDSVYKILKKYKKGNIIVLTDKINDSTYRTFHIYKKTKQPVLACYKSISDSIKREIHYEYIAGKLVKVYLETWNTRAKNVSFTTVYFKNGIALSPQEIPDLGFKNTSDLLASSDQLFARGIELYELSLLPK